MLKESLRLLVFAAALAASAALSAAESKRPDGTQAAAERFSFGELDVDYDGRLTRREAAFKSLDPDWFRAADRNGDGKLTRREFSSAREREERPSTDAR